MGNNPPANGGDARDAGSIPVSGRSPGVGNGNTLQNSRWEIPWIEKLAGYFHRVAESQTRLSAQVGAQTPANPRSSLEYKKYKPGGVQPEAEIHVRAGARRGAGTPSVKVTGGLEGPREAGGPGSAWGGLSAKGPLARMRL